MDLTENIVKDALDRYPNEYPKQLMVDARTMANWNREAYIRGRKDERELRASQKPETSDSALPTSDVSGSLLIPISTLRDWIDRLDMMEYDLNHRIYVKDDIEKLVTDAEKQ